MKYFYDTEFIENGKTIDLISIGIVADDGREYYAVNADAPWDRIEKHTWLMRNVVWNLSPYGGSLKGLGTIGNPYDRFGSVVRPKVQIADEVKDFILRPNEPVELWGYYSSYDHVVLAQLFGTMMNLPRGIPMWTNDVQQVAASLGLDNSLPPQAGVAHNALNDARWTREAWRYLDWRVKATEVGEWSELEDMP